VVVEPGAVLGAGVLGLLSLDEEAGLLSFAAPPESDFESDLESDLESELESDLESDLEPESEPESLPDELPLGA
jgi:hypothetical protein